jgi:hypothetical protein
MVSFGVNGQSDTLSGWTFSDTTDLSFNANMGLTGNQGYNIRPEDTAGAVRTAFYAPGATDYAAATDGWDNGADNKFWSIRFKAEGYSSMRLWSKQSSDPNHPGPKYWKIQTRKSGQGWADVQGGDITVGADWTTGLVDNLALPASFDDPGSSSLFVRWIMTSDEAVDGSTVMSDGISLIDDILITGINIIGVEEVLFDTRTVQMYPNPAVNSVRLDGIDVFEKVEVFNVAGVLQGTFIIDGESIEINTASLDAGLYIIRLSATDDQMVLTRKLVINR